MSALPLRLMTLFVRQLSRPLALGITSIANKNEMCRNICIQVFKQVNIWDRKLQNRLELNNTKIHSEQIEILAKRFLKHKKWNHTNVERINQRLIEQGASIISEFILYGIITGFIFFETIKSKNNEATKRNELATDILTLQDEIEHLKKQLLNYQIEIQDYSVPSNSTKPIILKINADGTISTHLNDHCKDPETCNKLRAFLEKSIKNI